MSVSRQNVWQKVLAKDVVYNNYRFPSNQYNNNYQLKNLYLKRRTQLSRDSFQDQTIVNKDSIVRQQYYQLRVHLLTKKFGPVYTSSSNSIQSKSRTPSLQSLTLVQQMELDLSDGSIPISGVSCHKKMMVKVRQFGEVVPTERASASRALAGSDTVAEGYSFAGIKHVFDHCTAAVTRLRFAHNDASRLALTSLDGSLSVCRTWPALQERVLVVMCDNPSTDDNAEAKAAGMNDLAWSSANDFILTGDTDGCVRLWNVESAKVARVYRIINGGEIFCVQFQPMNNNLFVAGASDGVAQLTNLSTGKPVNGGRDRLQGSITAAEFEQASGSCLWVGTSAGVVQSYVVEPSTGRITRSRRLSVSPSPTSSPVAVHSLHARAWVSREARDPCLLASISPGGLYFFRIVSASSGQLVLKNRFPLPPSVPSTLPVRACFCPLISFRQGACAVTGSRDGNVRVWDVTAGQLHSPKQCLTVLQGHSGCVIDVAVSCDEKVLASCDENGQVILWKRTNDTDNDDNRDNIDDADEATAAALTPSDDLSLN